MLIVMKWKDRREKMVQLFRIWAVQATVGLITFGIV